jgi:chaperone BCS1
MMSAVDVRPDDECYNFLMAWVANQRFSQGARRFVVNTNLNSVSDARKRSKDEPCG